MEVLLSSLPALLTLAALEIVLGIDNIVFIAIVTAKLKEEQRAFARRLGLGLAAAGRIVLLFGITWLIMLQDVYVTPEWDLWGFHVHMSVKDLVILLGGLFLIGKATWEIHHNMEGDVHEHGHPTEGHQVARAATSTFGTVLTQILLLDLVFSIDSVLTAIGMVDPADYEGFAHFPGTEIPWVPLAIMASAIIIAIIVMLVFVNPVSRFVENHPTVKMLALSFLVLIGVVLCAEAFHQAIPRGYIYSAMGFSLGVELLNQRVAASKKRKRDAAAPA